MLKNPYEPKPIQLVDVETQQKLNLWNFVAGILHAVLALMILSVRVFHGAPFVMRFEVMWTSIEPDRLPPFLVSNKCPWNYTTHVPAPDAQVHTDIFEWFQCHRDHMPKTLKGSSNQLIEDDVRARLYQLKPQERGIELPVWSLLFVFELVTSIMHFLLRYTFRGRYMYFLARRMQPFRWAEYAFTSSIMLWCLFSLSRLTEIYLLTAMFFLSVFLELCGGLAFEVLTFVLDRHVKRGKERQLINVLRWVLYALSWGVFILSYVAIWDAFLSIVNPYMSLENGDLWAQLFSFVGILNGVILVAYCSFPLLHLWQVLRPEQYVTVELGYIVASWVSKTILTVTIFIAAVQRKD